MTEKPESEFEQLWQQYSKEDLWNRVSEWWESVSRSRVVMLLAMHHSEELSLSEIVAKAGESEAFVFAVLSDLEKQNLGVCQGTEGPKYRIGDETAFLKFMHECCRRASASAGFMSTLAGWAGKSD